MGLRRAVPKRIVGSGSRVAAPFEFLIRRTGAPRPARIGVPNEALLVGVTVVGLTWDLFSSDYPD